MENWMQVNFTNELEKWFKDNPNVDADVVKLWPKLLKRAKVFDSIRTKYQSMEKSSLASVDGCFFTNAVAVHAVLLAKSLGSLTSLIVWKDLSTEKAQRRAEKRDHSRHLEVEEQRVKVFQGEPMKPEFCRGKEILHLLILSGLDSWGENDWIQQAYFQMCHARSLAFGSFNVYGTEHMEGKKYCISADCFIKNIKPTQTCAYEEGYVTVKGDNRVFVAAEAAMLAYWKIAHHQLQILLETKLQSWSPFLKFFPND